MILINPDHFHNNPFFSFCPLVLFFSNSHQYKDPTNSIYKHVRERDDDDDDDDVLCNTQTLGVVGHSWMRGSGNHKG